MTDAADSPFVFAKPADVAGDGRRVVLPATLGSRDALFDALSEGLQFPGYFGRNWDALDECLRDLDVPAGGRIVLVHPVLPALTVDALGTYLAILRSACEHRHAAGDGEFVVVLPPDPVSRWLVYAATVAYGEIDPPFAEQWAAFEGIYNGRPESEGPPIAWRPGRAEVVDSNLGQLMAKVGIDDYRTFHAWTSRERATFWEAVIGRLGIRFARAPEAIVDLGSGVASPRWLPGAELNIVESCFKAPADRVAIVSRGETPDPTSASLRRTTYGDLNRLVNRVANGLVRHGFARGDAVALYMPMTVECVAAYLGIVRAGLAVVSVADSFSPTELARRLEIAGAKGIVTVASYTRGGREIDLFVKVCEAEAPRAIVIPGAAAAPPAALRAGDLSWEEFLADADRFAAVAADPEATTNILFSSGTTGDPKAIPWTHLTPLKCAMDGQLHHDIHPADVVAWPTNIGWMMGPWLIYATLVNDATIALYEGAPVGPDFTRFIADAGVTMLGVVPSLVRAWRASGACDGVDWSGIRTFSSTGEPSNREDYLWLMSRSGYRAPVIEYLGGTEIGGGHLTGTVVQPASPSTFTTPALGLDFVILGADGAPVADGQMGELFLIPPSIGLSQRLLNRDHHEVYYADCPEGPNGVVLRRHGDEISRLAGGFYRAQGRADDTMNLGGIKVSSLELERVFDDHPAVYEAAAVAVQLGGEGAERLVVFAVLNGPHPDRAGLTKELGQLLAKQLNPLFKIHDLVVVDSLPRTASNKLMRRSLRARYHND